MLRVGLFRWLFRKRNKNDSAAKIVVILDKRYLEARQVFRAKVSDRMFEIGHLVHIDVNLFYEVVALIERLY